MSGLVNCIPPGQDPYVKPSYLFALVAGDLASIASTFTTRSTYALGR